MSYETDHLARLDEALANLYGLTNLAKWIEERTILDGKRFSFKGHEFQRTVINDAAVTSIASKHSASRSSPRCTRQSVPVLPG